MTNRRVNTPCFHLDVCTLEIWQYPFYTRLVQVVSEFFNSFCKFYKIFNYTENFGPKQTKNINASIGASHLTA